MSKFAVLKHDSWDAARIFVADTQEEADAEAWAYARACWAEWQDDTSDEAWNDALDQNFEWYVDEANMHSETPHEA